MNYVDSNLLSGETVAYRAQLHWIVYLRPAFILFLALVDAIFAMSLSREWRGVMLIIAGVVGAVAALDFIAARVRILSSEFAVTNKRVIIKLGLFTRRTLEMNLVKVESVGVEQSFLERALGCGTIVVIGSGGTKEWYSRIAAPLEFRKAVEAATLP